MKNKNRKAVSQVVGTVMLIAITIMAVAIIASIIIPLVRDSLEGGASCFELRDHLEVRSSKRYSCYNGSADETRVMIKRNFNNVSIEGIVVGLEDGGRMDSFEINGKANSNVKMLNSSGGEENARLLGPGEAKTYIFEGYSSKAVSVAVKTSGRTCDEQDYNLPKCRSY